MFKKNKELSLLYSTSAGIPYEWTYEIDDPSIVYLERCREIKKDKRMRGGHIDIIYTFKGLKKGNTKIIFRYISLINNLCEEEYVHTIEVDDELNIIEKKD